MESSAPEAKIELPALTQRVRGRQPSAYLMASGPEVWRMRLIFARRGVLSANSHAAMAEANAPPLKWDRPDGFRVKISPWGGMTRSNCVATTPNDECAKDNLRTRSRVCQHECGRTKRL